MVLLILHEVSRGFPSPLEVGVEDIVVNLILWLKLAAELTGVLIIGGGVAVTLVRLLLGFSKNRRADYERTRLILARFLALGLELQLAADIIATAVSPSWNQVGKLGAIAVIRTGLNYFLAREVKEEQEAIAKNQNGTMEASEP
ncbi:MAG: DUF1622 domain-containing protein [Pyrinomonadaceae bacterium]|nr:DUF1622 domain-containing protein [Pyrinomonadaceae bacterium]